MELHLCSIVVVDWGLVDCLSTVDAMAVVEFVENDSNVNDHR